MLWQNNHNRLYLKQWLLGGGSNLKIFVLFTTMKVRELMVEELFNFGHCFKSREQQLHFDQMLNPILCLIM